MKAIKKLAALVAVIFAIKYRKDIKNMATKLVEKGRSKVVQTKVWLKEVR